MVRSFQAVELTSRCNLSCKYCPHSKMKRDKIDMPEHVFQQVLFWLEKFKQDIIHLQMIGESTLHPDLLSYIERIHELVPTVNLSTNGVGVTRELIRGMKESGLNRLTVSIHRPEVAQLVIKMCQEEGLTNEWGTGPINNHTWAGQVSTPMLSDHKPLCDFLLQSSAVVLSDGRVVACCLDAEGISSNGLSVWNDLTSVRFRPYKLCQGCHHRIPEEVFPGWQKELELNPNRAAAGRYIGTSKVELQCL